jgi:tetratricopeptide (TPR) repeat protein
MRDLVELVGLVNKTKLKAGGIMKFIIEPDSKMERLFNALLDGKVKTDDDAKALFKDDDANVSNLKNKLKERLLDAIFLLDFKDSNFTNRQKAFFECYKKWSAAMTLLIRNAKVIGIDVLERLLRHAKHFEFTELTLDILRVLRLQYSTVDGDIEKYEQTKAQYAEYEKIWQMESKAELYYSELMAQYTNSKSTKKEVTDQAKEYYAELKPFMAVCSSFKLHLFGRMVNLLIYNSVNDYVNTAKLCEEAIAFFDKKDYDSGLPLQVFYYNLIVCYLQLGEFDKGQKAIERCEYFFEEGSFNWFKLQELFFLLAMRTGHWEEAYHLYEKVTNYPRFNDRQVQIVEMWKIFQAYVFYLIRVGKIPEKVLSEKTKKFRMGKFMSEITLFSRDRSGMNVSILIAQILYGIAEKDYKKTSDRIEAIEKYCVRHLKGEPNARSKAFIKMLLEVPQARFHREGARRKAERYQKQLAKTPLNEANQAHEVEIVPYEMLWEMTLESLQMKAL